MDYKEYKQTYAQLLSDQGRGELGSDTANREKLEAKVNRFLELYPSVIPPDRNPNTPFTRISIKELTNRSLKSAVDIIHDVSTIISEKDALTNTQFRRKLFGTVTAPERRLYVGIWLVFLSFVLYFIDSAA